MSETMIERVAKAIGIESDGTWDNLTASRQRFHRDVARAAIEAMREPTDAMIDAGVISEWGGTIGSRVINAYQDMIDSALSQSPHSLPSEDR